MFCSPHPSLSPTRGGSHVSATNSSKRTKKQHAIMVGAVRKLSGLSVGEKYLYQLILDYDFADKETKLCKGYIYASVATLAAACDESERTVYRWLQTLLKTKLIARQRRQNKTSKLLILDLPPKLVPTNQNERQLPTAANAYKGKETKRKLQELEKIQELEAKSSTEVTELIALGYAPEQAVRDYVQYGAAELHCQIANLNFYLQAGKQFFSYAKWLNWAIRAKHRIDGCQIAACSKRETCAEEQRLKQRTKYIEMVDADGYTYFQEVDADDSAITKKDSRSTADASLDLVQTVNLEEKSVAEKHNYQAKLSTTNPIIPTERTTDNYSYYCLATPCAGPLRYHLVLEHTRSARARLCRYAQEHGPARAGSG